MEFIEGKYYFINYEGKSDWLIKVEKAEGEFLHQLWSCSIKDNKLKSEYTSRGQWGRLSSITYSREASVEEVLRYLPDGHPDKTEPIIQEEENYDYLKIFFKKLEMKV